uniref:Fe2OG dioxygenase domain-containing protein n=1 Tax=Chromera velia CCMP2878 TaxID=1169474 RepID=A0A0G4HXQ2_9ALVE|eukprot:Cvel_9315.t1-p1 / transcript=Cvel_9315.t1 / gene=Cvel_9315 / organism=Chromera_velia_CCMP2878 / gene_product=hypothetical protein / transcript_product=hypothetical protein / location=Cvel_scaffold534:17451-19782(+) / protein_length=384 / sequence_SO=supercontig / SO=protein_coding / is_pseudo=false
MNAAPFGDQFETRVDPKVRDALQLQVEKGAFGLEGLRPDGVLGRVLRSVERQMFGLDSAGCLSASLYSLNAYREGGFFKPHRDTYQLSPPGADRDAKMVGTLVVFLPSRFVGGELVVQSESGAMTSIPSLLCGESVRDGGRNAPLEWVAFFGDAVHEVGRVRGGVRLTATFTLWKTIGESDAAERETGTSPSSEALTKFSNSLRSFASARKAGLHDRPFLLWDCVHLYSEDEMPSKEESGEAEPSFESRLKGGDASVAAAARKAGLIPRLFKAVRINTKSEGDEVPIYAVVEGEVLVKTWEPVKGDQREDGNVQVPDFKGLDWLIEDARRTEKKESREGLRYLDPCREIDFLPQDDSVRTIAFSLHRGVRLSVKREDEPGGEKG